MSGWQLKKAGASWENSAPFHWLVVLAVVVLLFGGKKIPEVMRGLGEGIRSFKEGMHGNAQGMPQTTQVSPPPTSTSTRPPRKRNNLSRLIDNEICARGRLFWPPFLF